MVNFWLHALTPLAFMLWLCCTRLFPYCSYCAYWNIFKTAIDNWNRLLGIVEYVVLANNALKHPFFSHK